MTAPRSRRGASPNLEVGGEATDLQVTSGVLLHGRPARWFIAAVVAVTVLSAGVALAQAQPQLPDQWFQQRQPEADGDAISFCVDLRDPGHVVDGAVAEAIALGLLVNVRLQVIDSVYDDEDFESLFFSLSERCSVFLGFRLYADTYPGWMTITRSMYEGRFVVLTANPDWRRFDDIPVDVPIGVVQGSLGDVRFLLSNNTLPAAQRRPRFPLGHPTFAFDGLMNGRVGALLVWEPWWWWLKQSRPELAALHVVEARHISEPPVGVGGVLLADRTFVRAAVDQAIGALIQDGTIQEIIDAFTYPGHAR
jgi:polar amino acid transport system substrate-binding protein